MSENKINVVIKNTATSMPYTIYLSAILASLVSGDYKFVLFAAFALLFGDGANALEKQIFKFASNESDWGKRPQGCGIRDSQKGTCTGCGIYPEFGKTSSTWGMPSGHAQITAFAATFWTLYILAKQKDDPKSSIISRIIVIWLIALAVWIQRIYSRCHSIPQILVGASFGAGFGVLSYYICNKINKEKFPSAFT